MAFVAVLSFSRQIFLRFCLDARMENFCAAISAPSAWHGVPRVLLYDNLKSAVLERYGDAIRFNPALLVCRPLSVRAASGGDRARQREGPGRESHPFVRDSFFAARKFADLEDLNAAGRGLV